MWSTSICLQFWSDLYLFWSPICLLGLQFCTWYEKTFFFTRLWSWRPYWTSIWGMRWAFTNRSTRWIVEVGLLEVVANCVLDFFCKSIKTCVSRIFRNSYVCLCKYLLIKFIKTQVECIWGGFNNNRTWYGLALDHLDIKVWLLIISLHLFGKVISLQFLPRFRILGLLTCNRVILGYNLWQILFKVNSIYICLRLWTRLPCWAACDPSGLMWWLFSSVDLARCLFSVWRCSWILFHLRMLIKLHRFISLMCLKKHGWLL